MTGFRIPELRPVGFARTPFSEPGDVRDTHATEGEIEVLEELEPALLDVEGFSHLHVIWLFHRSEGYEMQCCPTRYRIPPPRGLFATRSPYRPNPLALTVVRLLGRDGRVLRVRGVDMVDGTPVLDLKPYTRRDRKSHLSCGWLEEVDLESHREGGSRR